MSIKTKETKKTKTAEEFLPQNGFKKENDLWVFDLNDQIISPEHLKINKENV